MNNSNKVLWFAAGAAIGATLGILFAPQSGEDTRRFIGTQARKGREKGRELYDRGREMADEAADMMEAGMDRARRTFQG
jgi:gas vesicle protein